MKKLPHKFKFPLMISMVMPSMLLGMPAIMAYRNLSEGSSFFDAWMGNIANLLPSALLLLAVVAPLARLFVSKVLVEPAEVK